jgi:hypothetical protein
MISGLAAEPITPREGTRGLICGRAPDRPRPIIENDPSISTVGKFPQLIDAGKVQRAMAGEFYSRLNNLQHILRSVAGEHL